MEVQAKARGYYGCLREPGDKFDVPDDEEKSSWFEPVKRGGKKGQTGEGTQAPPDDGSGESLA